MSLRVYHYPRCSTCRKALAWLTERGVDFELVDLVLHPPSVQELAKLLALSGRPLAKLFNTSGQSYREGNFKARLPSMSESQALAALSSDGKLIKRPLIVGDDFAVIGFDVEALEAKV